MHDALEAFMAAVEAGARKSFNSGGGRSALK